MNQMNYLLGRMKSNSVLYKSDGKYFCASFPEIRKHLIGDSEFRLRSEFEMDDETFELLESGHCLFLGGENYVSLPVSNTIYVYYQTPERLVFDDPKLSIKGEYLVPAVESFLLNYFPKDFVSNGLTVSFQGGDLIENVTLHKDLVLEFYDHHTLTEEGVRYKDPKTNQLVWFCSCFRCYFDFNEPPKFIGISVKPSLSIPM